MGLDEFALCIARDSLPKAWLGNQVALPVSRPALETFFSSVDCQFLCRRQIEQEPSIKQIIPYVLVFNSKGELLAYRRHGTEARLHQLWSVGVGGHVNQTDSPPGTSPLRCIEAGMRRECFEELGATCSDFQLRGIINEEMTEVGHVHVGIVFSTILPDDNIPSSSELGNVTFYPLTQIQNLQTELWSQLALSLIRDERTQGLSV